MITYMQEGAANKKLIKIEKFLIDLLKVFLENAQELPGVKDEIFKVFFEAFKGLNERIQPGCGLYILPVHRAFGFYLSRLTSCDEINSYTRNEFMKVFLKVYIKSISFIHEIKARKWIYNGLYLEKYS